MKYKNWIRNGDEIEDYMVCDDFLRLWFTDGETCVLYLPDAIMRQEDLLNMLEDGCYAGPEMLGLDCTKTVIDIETNTPITGDDK